MRLSQEAIQRMVSGRSGGGGGGGSFDPSTLAGYATQAWTEENYISKTFFNELFIIHKKVTTVVMDGDTEISRTVTTDGIFAPNEIPGTTTETDEETGYVTTVTTEISSIESKKGFWTNYFLSALGLNGEGGGGGLTLNEPLATINVSGLANHPSSSGQTIVWNGTAWVYGTAGGGTGTVTGVKVGDITYSPVNGIVSIPAYPTSLAWSAITGKPTTLAGYGITDAKIENGVITLGSNTITPLTSSDITDMATKTWVGQQGFALASNVYSKTDADAKFMTIAAFENLFNALNSSDQKVNHPYSSGVASIKAMVGLWTEQYLSALGKSDSGGEIVLNEPLASINDAGLAAHPSSSGQTIVWNGSAWTYGTAGGSGMTYTFATGDANGQFKVTPSSGAAYNVSIKGLAALAYKASLAVSDIPDLSSRYLPLTGGTLTGGLTISHSSGLTIWDTNHVHDMDFFWATYQVTEGDTRDIFTMYAYESPRYWDMCIGTHPNAIGNKSLYYNSSTMRWGIGTANPTYTLDVVGTAKATTVRATDIYIGGIHITADNNGIHINSAGLYADTYVSALGLSDSGGSAFDEAAMWQALGTNITDKDIALVYIQTGADTRYALKTDIPTLSNLSWSYGSVTTASGNSYNGGAARSFVIPKATSHLTNDSGFVTSSALGSYLPLTGGTINGNLAIRGISHQNFSISSSAETSGVKWTGVQFQHVVNDTNVVYGGIRMDEQNGSFFRYNSSYTTYQMWDAGNDGAGSGLDADLLDGQHASYFATAANLTTANGKITTLEGYFDNGVANSAKRLIGSTSYTAWGQTYWQNGVPNSISGNMTNVGSITMNGMLNINNSNGIAIWDTQHIHDVDFFWTTYEVTEDDTRDIFTIYSYESPRYWDISLGTHPNSIIGNNGIYYSGATARWGVKTLTPVCMFDIDGYAKANRLYLYKPNANNDTDAIYLEYNSANGGVHLVGGGLYADTYVSALGLSNIGGAAFDESAMWQALGTTITEKQISSAYLTNALAPYALKTDIPTLKTLTIQNNGTQIGTYNGTTAVTVNIPLPKVLDNLYATRPTTANVSFTDGGLRQFKATSSMLAANGKPTRGNGDAHILHFGWDGSGWDAQFAILTSMQGVQYRTRNGSSSTWETWRTIIDNNNIAEFANSLYVSSLGTSGDYLTWTKNGVANNITIPYAQYTKILRSSIMATTDDYETLANYTVERGSFVTTNQYSYTSIPNINDYDTLVSFGYGNRTFQIKSRAYYETFSYRTVTNPSQGVYKFGNWKTIAFTDGNVASAIRLEGTATKSAWGQTYWSNGQPQNISGNMTSVGNITMSGNLTMGGELKINNSNGITIWDTAHTHDMAMFWDTVSAINRDAFNIYSYEGTYYDVSLGVNANYVESLGGLYFSALQWAWGIGTNTPGRRFGSENVGLKLDVAGIARANQLQAYNTAGETLQLNTTATYNCILYRINDALKWSVGADSGNNFYWYTQPGGNKTVMYLTSAGVLNVGNSVKCTDLWIGNIHITYDSANGGIHVANGGLSANTYVSALGVGQEGGGSQGLDIEAMWTELATPNSARQIDSSHISSALSNYVTTNTLSGYATQQWVNQQGFVKTSGVTSVAMSVPSSLRVNTGSGATITTSGTFAITLASGYSIPTTAKQSNWDTAYGWGNHATAGYSTPQGVANQMQSYAYISGNVIHIGDSSITPLTSHQSVDGTFWGRSWSNHGTVSGSIEAGNSGGYIGGFDHIDLNTHASLYGYGGYIDFYYNGANSYTSRIIEEESGVLSIKAPNVAGLLVGGYNGDYVQIGQIRIVYDYSNNALKVMHSNGGAANLYALGGISALGISSSSSGSVSSSLIPGSSGEYDLGSTSYKWRNLYLYNGGAFSIVPNSSTINFQSNKKISINSDVELVDETNLYVDNRICIGSNNSSYAFYVSGNSYLTGSISASNVINRSDMRIKDFVENMDLSVDAIAKAPSFKFTFKDGDSRLRVGTSAQYWRGALPESVFSDADGMLGLDYGVTALVSVISVARKVMTHEEEIADLKRRLSGVEKENEQLRNEIEMLKAA